MIENHQKIPAEVPTEIGSLAFQFWQLWHFWQFWQSPARRAAADFI
jgi:hypothetical protein